MAKEKKYCILGCFFAKKHLFCKENAQSPYNISTKSKL